MIRMVIYAFHLGRVDTHHERTDKVAVLFGGERGVIGERVRVRTSSQKWWCRSRTLELVVVVTANRVCQRSG